MQNETCGKCGTPITDSEARAGWPAPLAVGLDLYGNDLVAYVCPACYGPRTRCASDGHVLPANSGSRICLACQGAGIDIADQVLLFFGDDPSCLHSEHGEYLGDVCREEYGATYEYLDDGVRIVFHDGSAIVRTGDYAIKDGESGA